MIYNKKLIHLVTQILQDRAFSMLNENSALVDISARENVAQQLATVRDFYQRANKSMKARKKLPAWR